MKGSSSASAALKAENALRKAICTGRWTMPTAFSSPWVSSSSRPGATTRRRKHRPAAGHRPQIHAYRRRPEPVPGPA
eukprot:11720411-Alexandrium_andersonii.AAC.1